MKHITTRIAATALLTTGLIGSALAFPPYPPGKKMDAKLTLTNQFAGALSLKLDASSTTAMNQKPSALIPSQTYNLDGSGYYNYGGAEFTLTIGDTQYPQGTCIIKAEDDPKGSGDTVIQQTNGSQGFTCSLSGTTVTVKPA